MFGQVRSDKPGSAKNNTATHKLPLFITRKIFNTSGTAAIHAACFVTLKN
jgi:hypothetical protein